MAKVPLSDRPATAQWLIRARGEMALTGIRHRSWWYGLPVALALCLPFGSMWLDYLTVMRNTVSDRGLEYVLGEWPIALALVVVAWSGTMKAAPFRERLPRLAAA